MANLSDLGYRSAAQLQPGQTQLPGGRIVGAGVATPNPGAQSVATGGYTQSPSNYYPSTQSAQAAPAQYPRGPQAIAPGTPGTYQSGGGRVIPTAYKPVAAAQTAYAHGAGKGQDMQSYMTNQGFGTDYFSGGTLGGVSSTGFNWDTMSSPAMDAAAGKTNHTIGELMQAQSAQVSPSDLAKQVSAFQAEGNPPSWYVPGATSYEQVIATQNQWNKDPFGGQVIF